MKIEKFRDTVGELRARVVARNGKILFVTSEGYKDMRDLDNAIGLLADNIDVAPVIDLTAAPK